MRGSKDIVPQKRYGRAGYPATAVRIVNMRPGPTLKNPWRRQCVLVVVAFEADL